MTCSLLKTNPDTWKFSLSVLSSANRNGRTHVVQRLHLRLLSSSSPSSTTIQQEQARHVCPRRVGREIPPLCAVPRWRPRDRARGGRQRRRTTIYNLHATSPFQLGSAPPFEAWGQVALRSQAPAAVSQARRHCPVRSGGPVGRW